MYWEKIDYKISELIRWMGKDVKELGKILKEMVMEAMTGEDWI